MIVVFFRARRIEVRLGQLYLDALRRMDLTTKIPGYVSHKPVSRRTPRG